MSGDLVGLTAIGEARRCGRRCPGLSNRAARSSLGGRGTLVPSQRTFRLQLVQRHPCQPACADRRGSNFRGALRQCAVGHGDHQPRPPRYTASRQRLVTAASEARSHRVSCVGLNPTQALITFAYHRARTILLRLRATLSRVAVLWNAANLAFTPVWRAMYAAGRSMGLVLFSQPVRQPHPRGPVMLFKRDDVGLLCHFWSSLLCLARAGPSRQGRRKI